MTQTQKKKHNKTTKQIQTHHIKLKMIMCNLNASLEQLSVTDEPLTGNTSDTDHILDRMVKLRKYMKVKFTLGNSEELKSATLISRSGKATGKYME